MNDNPGRVLKAGLVIGVTVIAIGITLASPPIPQDPAYHAFADRRTWLGIPNFWNIMSNLAFLGVGLAGLVVLARRVPAGGLPALRLPYTVFFTGILLTAAGSSFYHLEPANASLLWDRLPMSLAFMAFMSSIVGENIGVKVGRRLLWPAVAAGLLSVMYWHYSESLGRGDLGAYALVQFLPLLLMPLILLLFRSPFTGNAWLWLILPAYAGAKLAELNDAVLFAATGFGGHALKHLLAALAALCFLIALLVRRPVTRHTTSAANRKSGPAQRNFTT